MFVLNELDKVLQLIGVGSARRRQTTKTLQISLADINRIDIESLELSKRVPYPPPNIQKELETILNVPARLDLSSKLVAPRKHLTTDYLFATQMKDLLFDRLSQMPERHYPSAKLLICDHNCFNAIMKFHRILLSTESSKNLIYRHPFNVTAVLQLQDVLKLFAGEPVILTKRDNLTGFITANFNYDIIKKNFPYLRICDLVIFLTEPKNLNLNLYNHRGGREEQIFQFLSHFARSSELIELQTLYNHVGQPHPIYDNIFIFQPSTHSGKNPGYKPPTLEQLSLLSQKLVRLSYLLRVELQSISYRDADSRGLTKAFSQMLANDVNLMKSSQVYGDGQAKILVIDRFFDLQGPLYHADRYGPFLEQENQIVDMTYKFRVDTVDELDEKLQLVQLTSVLETILKHSLGSQQKATKSPRGGQLKSPQTGVATLTSVLSNNQSIRKHLNLIKIVYKCLNGGYLLMLKLESSLASVMAQLRSLKEPLDDKQQALVIERLKRIKCVLDQLVKMGTKTIRLNDIVRMACILVDILNVFLHKHANKSSEQACKTLKDMKESIINGKEFRSWLRTKQKLSTEHNEQELDIENFFVNIKSFDAISQQNCAQKRSTLSLEGLLEKFLSSNQMIQDDQDSFTSISLTSTKLLYPANVLVLVFLGSMSAHEMAQVKLLELSLRRAGRLSDIILVSYCQARPDDLVELL